MRRALVGRCHGDVARGHVATDVIMMAVRLFTVNVWQGEVPHSSAPRDLMVGLQGLHSNLTVHQLEFWYHRQQLYGQIISLIV